MNFLDEQITIRTTLAFFFYNGVVFIPLYALISRFIKPLAQAIAGNKLRRYEKSLKKAKEDFEKSNVTFDGADLYFFKISAGLLFLDALGKLL